MSDIEILKTLSTDLVLQPPIDSIIFKSKKDLFKPKDEVVHYLTQVFADCKGLDGLIEALRKSDSAFALCPLPNDFQLLETTTTAAGAIRTSMCSIRYTLLGLTNDINWNSIKVEKFNISNTVPLNDSLFLTLNNLSLEFDTQILITRDDCYQLAESTASDAVHLYLIGNEFNILQAKNDILAILKLYSDKKRKLLTMDLDSFSTIVNVLGLTNFNMDPDQNNLSILSKIYNIHFTSISSLLLPFYHSDNEILLNDNTTTRTSFKHALQETKNFTPNINLVSDSIVSNEFVAKIINQMLDYSFDKKYYTRIINLPISKILFLQKFKKNQLNKFMLSNQLFMKFNDNFIEVQSNSNSNLSNICKMFTTDFIQEIVEFTIFYNHTDIDQNNNSTQQHTIQSISHILKDEPFLIIKSNNFPNQLTIILEVNALLNKIDELIQLNNEKLITIKQFKLVFQIHNEFNNFISGKKNGKLIKIMEKSPNCLIKLTDSSQKDTRTVNNSNNNNNNDFKLMDSNFKKIRNDLNDNNKIKGHNDFKNNLMSMELINNSITEFPSCLKDLINELPTEYSFFIPELYHRPIIGSGGSIIQTIMRKYNVFIQFCNSYDLPQNNLSLMRYDNVIIRCPNKNKHSIEIVKSELLKLVNNFNKLQNFQLLPLTLNTITYISLNNKYTKMIQLERDNNVFIDWGAIHNEFNKIVDNDNDSNVQTINLKIHGNDKTTCHRVTKEFLLNICPHEIELTVTNNFHQLRDENWERFKNEIIIPYKLIWNSMIRVCFKTNLIYMTFENEDFLNKQLEFITVYLSNDNIKILKSKKIN